MVYRKMKIDVICEHTRDGFTHPLRLRLEDGTVVNVDRFLCKERAASTKVGGCGMRYTVMIGGFIKYLFEDDGIWYVEARSES